MNISRDVITDLWPLYAAGEASPDTQALIEEFLRQDPEFAHMLQQSGEADPFKSSNPPALAPDREAQSLNRAKRIMHGQDWLFFMAMLWSGFAFGRIISDTSFDVSPRNFIVTASIAAVFWIAYLVRIVWTRRKIYRKQNSKAHQ
jgi:hypothetical protein